MSEQKQINDGGPAAQIDMPMTTHYGLVVLNLRDQFAGLAMQGLLAGDANPDVDPMSVPGDLEKRAAWAYRIADAMLAERSKGQ